MHGPSVRVSPNRLLGDAYGQIEVAVAIEVTGSQGLPKQVMLFSRAFSARAVLMPVLDPRRGEAIVRAVYDVDRSGMGYRARAVIGDADGQVGEAVAIEVRQRY